MFGKKLPPTRRQFLRQAACAALTTAAVTNTLWDLRLVRAATTASFTDYKALVCIFLFGGNDANNLIVPTDTASYNAYAAARGSLAIPLAQLLPINPTVSDGHTYGLHPNCTGLQTMFENGQLAILANVGTLVGPVTRTSYLNKTAALPPQLFSHNDQQVQWQTSIPDQPPRTGWGGRCADLVFGANNSSVSMNISLAGTNVYEVGQIIQPYSVSTSGAVGLTSVTGTRLQAVKDLIALPHDNLFEQTFSGMTEEALANAALLSSAVASAPVTQTIFPNTSLGSQLKMIAKLISVHSQLGHTRQIYFASVGGYDLHGAQLAPHANLLNELSGSFKAMYDTMVELGLGDSVTTFTASDFGRTLPTNGLGSDHGWGSHALIAGGAVNGKRLYGTFPTLAINGPDDTGSGRWIPTTSVDQYSATLASWFGVSDTDLSTVFPNLNRFASRDLGFFLPPGSGSTDPVTQPRTKVHDHRKPRPHTRKLR
jgi:uncharacterized protein (DUF1501 family)